MLLFQQPVLQGGQVSCQVPCRSAGSAAEGDGSVDSAGVPWSREAHLPIMVLEGSGPSLIGMKLALTIAS